MLNVSGRILNFTLVFSLNFPLDRYPSFNEVKKNVSIVLLNSHFSQNGVQPYLPNVIEIGGVQIKEKASPLSEDIEQWIQGAEHGAVFVSLGANLRSADLSEESLELLFNTFRKLKQRVLWKFETKAITYFPKNVMVRDWLPQDDILAHPNLKAFVTSCELGSYNEALYHAVPIVGIPFANDQFTTAKRLQDEEWAEVVAYNNLTEEALDAALKQVLYVKSYKENVVRLSKLYRDRPAPALDTAVYWIEYVIRFQGAHHLKYQGRFLTVWQSLSLDIYAFVVVLVWLLYKFVSFSVRKFLNKKEKIIKKTKLD